MFDFLFITFFPPRVSAQQQQISCIPMANGDGVLWPAGIE